MVSEHMTLIAFTQSMLSTPRLGRMAAMAAAISMTALLSACQDSEGLRGGRAYKPIPAETIALMQEKGMTKHSPILMRAFKKSSRKLTKIPRENS